MNKMTLGEHHAHIRKRIYKKYEPFPHPNKLKRFMDKFIYAVALLGPIVTIPQIMKIWLEKNVSGVSLITWTGFLLAAFFWLCYAILHKEKPIMFSSIILIIVDTCVIVGIIFYG